ncbi:putative Zinc metalloproteinase nas-14 [Hypsibius exemplaris]|uniref:Metalloendopeptidase n=1 Tax=Hypsibius exemplaris TaxID=2072580 RepID=A0A9X6NRK2_HYPEX|nr:putative Zinc metalloproteinase nas-14 [Hypsibius exemplaris]
MNEMENATWLKFVEKTNQPDYIYIAQIIGAGCSSWVGRQNRGRQLLNLESGCWTKSTIQHELMHALGFFHEHARADRDEYVEIVSAHIQRGEEDNFRSWDNNTITAFGLPYDFDSILHYPSHLFARTNPVSGVTVGPTIRVRAKYAGKTFGLQTGLSGIDIRKIKLMYKCKSPDLGSGNDLKVGESLWSPDGNVRLAMETDGNLVLYNQRDGRVIWSSNMTYEDPAWAPTSVRMQVDGNLAMYHLRPRHLVWSTDTRSPQFSEAMLKVLDEGYFCLYKNNQCLWTSGGVSLGDNLPAPAFQTARGAITGYTAKGGILLRGQSLTSANEKCNITIQQDGDVILRRTYDNCDHEVWSVKHGTGRVHNLGYQEHASIDKLEMQEDGNLQLHLTNGERKALHSLVVDGRGADLRLSDDCRLCIFKDGSCRWRSYLLSHMLLKCYFRGQVGERRDTTKPHQTAKEVATLQWIVLTIISTGQMIKRELDVLYFVARNMFWVHGRAILVAQISHLRAGHKTIVSHTGIDWPSALAVHPSRGSIYWSHSGTTIETASMDGSNRQVLVTGVNAHSLALDYESNDLYWVDWITGNIECISLHGGGKRIVTAREHAGKDSYGISLSEKRVYWTSYYSSGAVNSITKSGTAMRQHSLPAGRNGYLFGIVFVPEQCPKLNNACAVSNGGCPFICLPLPENNKKCVCPDDNSSCTS